MNDKQAFAVIVGTILFSIFGGSLLLMMARIVAQLILGHLDSGDDIGWGLLWLSLTIISGILGATVSARWGRKRYPDSAP